VRRLQLSSRARTDIADIAAWSETHWGRNQRERYIDGLLTRLAGLLTRPQMGRPYGGHRPGLRRLRVGAHIAFYRFDGERVFVVRVLDQRMDVDAHLASSADD